MKEEITGSHDRRMFLKTSVAMAGGLAVGSLLRKVSAQPKVTTIRTGFTLAPEHPVGQARKRWGDNLTKKTNGAFVVHVHGGGVLGNSIRQLVSSRPTATSCWTKPVM